MGQATSLNTQDPTSTASLANAAAGIATGFATGGPIGASIATGFAALSFIQASKQMQMQQQAERDAAKALEEAKRQININPFAALGIQKEPYELEREALLAQGAQAIAAGQESDRGAAATAGRIYAGQIAEQQGQRAAMGKDLMNLEKQTAEEQTNIKDALAGVALKETEGYQKQAADAAKARAQAIQQGYQSGAKALEYGLGQVPLFIDKGGNGDSRSTKNTLYSISQNAERFAAGTPQGSSNYVMQDQQRQPIDFSKNPNWWSTLPQQKYDPYNQNPFLFYNQQ